MGDVSGQIGGGLVMWLDLGGESWVFAGKEVRDEGKIEMYVGATKGCGS